MAICILKVTKGSIAARAGINPGDTLIRINGEDILDEIDYQALIATHRLEITLQDQAGQERILHLHKPANAPLGLQLDEQTILKPRSCKNHCIFCFVDQMPEGMRPSLYVKDDDWRLSLMMGNFVTLTNVDDLEFERIIRRKASPLYISVHATDPETRIRMLRNPNAGNMLERLKRMAEAGLKFHCQVVLCPGINDGSILWQTIVDLASLYPAAQSLAIVPIGLTDHRKGLHPLRLIQKDEAKVLIRDLELIQAHYLKLIGALFVFPADELYSLADLPIPEEDSYENYPQIENGIGMLRMLSNECEEYWPVLQDKLKEHHPLSEKERVLIPTGVSALKYIQALAEKYRPQSTDIDVFAVPNHFFGPSVTVTGLIVGEDLVRVLNGRKADRVLISRSMLRENEDCFLDDWTVDEVARKTGLYIRPVANTGEAFLNGLYGL